MFISRAVFLFSGSWRNRVQSGFAHLIFLCFILFLTCIFCSQLHDVSLWVKPQWFWIPPILQSSFFFSLSFPQNIAWQWYLIYIPIPYLVWRKAWQPTPVFLPGESHGQRNLVGYSPWGHKSQTQLSNTHTYTHPLTLLFPFNSSSFSSKLKSEVCSLTWIPQLLKLQIKLNNYLLSILSGSLMSILCLKNSWNHQSWI